MKQNLLNTINGKIELSSQRIELATVSEADALSKSLYKTMGVAADKAAALDKASSDLRSAINSVEEDLKSIRKVKTEISNQAKELGMNPKDVPAIKDLDSSENFAKQNLPRLKDRIK